MEKFYEHECDLYMLFIDFRQAFDSIWREELYQALKEMKIPGKLIRLVQMIMENTKARIKIGNKLSEVSTFNAVVKQGDGLSTVPFNLALHQAVDKVNQRGTIYFKSSQICAYADDIVIIGRNISTLKQIYLELEKEAERFGLVVNERKTKYMVMSTSSTKRIPQSNSIGNRTFEGVSQFGYLGALVNIQNEISDCINDKIQKGNSIFC
jgi:sorting nexin-29